MKNIYRTLKKNIIANLTLYKAQKKLKKFNEKFKDKKILLVSHMLTMSGSPLVLYYFAKKLKSEGFNPLVISYTGGTLMKSFEDIGIDVILGDIFQYKPEILKDFAKGFDKIIVNTIVCYSAIKHFDDAIWWIQEGKYVETCFMKDFPDLEDTLRKAKNIFVVSEYAKEALIKFNPNIQILKLGVEDHLIDKKKLLRDKVKFAIVGDINECKAQDVLVEAIFKLSTEYLSQSEFHFFCSQKGRRYKKIVKTTKKYKNIIFDGLFPNQEKKWKKFSEMDVFVVPSRDESCSLVAIEACMLKKPIIISENVGAKYMLKNGENGYIVKTDDSDDLKDAIVKIIDNKNKIEDMGNLSRLMYEQNASFELFDSEMQKITMLCEQKNV